EHAEKDFEQSLAEASQRTGMAHALIAFLLVIRLTPGAGFAKAIRPQVNCVAQKFVAGPTDVNFVDPARLIGNRCGSGYTLEYFLAAVALGIITHSCQQAWC